MTANQISYLRYQEEKRANIAREELTGEANRETRRSNLARESETYRANVARESETHRSNIANELITSNRDAETARANRAREQETHEHNFMTRVETERANRAKETETNRSNLAREAEANRANTLNAWVDLYSAFLRDNRDAKNQKLGRQKIAAETATQVVKELWPF